MNAVSYKKANGKLESVPVDVDSCACTNKHKQTDKLSNNFMSVSNHKYLCPRPFSWLLDKEH